MDYWVSYSYLDAERNYRDFPYQTVPTYVSKHNFPVVGKYFVKDIRSQIGLTYSYTSPRPYNNPNELGFNTGRTRPFHDVSLMSISHLLNPQVIIHGSVSNVFGFDNIFGYEYAGQPDNDGIYPGRAIKQPASRFFFVGIFLTLSKDKTANKLPEL